MAEPPPKRARTAAQEPPSVTPADVAPEAQSSLAAFLARPAAARTPPGKAKSPGPLPPGLAAAAAASLERCWAELPPADASVEPRPRPTSRDMTLIETRRLALAHVQVPPETLDEVSRALLAAARAARGAVLPTPEKKTQTPSPLQAPAPAPVTVAAPAAAPAPAPAARLRPTERANARRRAHVQAAAARRRRW